MKDAKIQALVDASGRIIATALVGTITLKNNRTATAGMLPEKGQRLLEFDAQHLGDYQSLTAEAVHERVNAILKTPAIAREVKL